MRTKTDKRQIEYVATGKLTPYARNSRTHSPQQVKQLAASIKEFGFTNPVLIDEANGIIAGHGRVMAAEHLQLNEVPCIRLEYLTETQKKAYVIADNKLALNAGWDEEMLKIELDELHLSNYNIELLGFNADELLEAMSLDNVVAELSQENPYTDKIETPTYEPSGAKPDIKELYDNEKADKLILEIRQSALPDVEKNFLISAASRHVVFNYSKIANYYAQSNKEMQGLMENSALVIIDYNKAIEQGLVKLTQQISETFGNDDAE